MILLELWTLVYLLLVAMKNCGNKAKISAVKTAWKLPKYRVISAPYFLVLGLNTTLFSSEGIAAIFEIYFTLKFAASLMAIYSNM